MPTSEVARCPADSGSVLLSSWGYGGRCFPTPTERLPVLTRRIRAASVAALVTVLAVSACGDGDSKSKATALDQTTVSGGSDTEAPKIEVKPTPLTVTETQTRVLKDGDGATVKGTEIVSLKYVLVNGKDGSQLDTNFGSRTSGSTSPTRTCCRG